MAENLQPGAGLQPAMSQEAAAIVTAALAGLAAEKHLGPFGSLQEAVAVHESAHAVSGHLSGSPVARISAGRPVGAPDWVGGFTSHVAEGKELEFVPGRGALSSDQRLALLFLRLADPAAGWRQLLRDYRDCRRRAEALVIEQAFPIRLLAAALRKTGELDGAAIAAQIEQTVKARGKLEIEATIHLAGKVGERRALRGSEDGWQRFRTADELRAHHEAAHAVAMDVFGLHVWRLSIVPVEASRVQKMGYSGGLAAGGETAEPPSPIERPARAETDLRQAVRECWTLGSPVPPYGFRGALRVAHRLKARARALVDGHWPLIARLAAELLEHRELERPAIEAILRPGIPLRAEQATHEAQSV